MPAPNPYVLPASPSGEPLTIGAPQHTRRKRLQREQAALANESKMQVRLKFPRDVYHSDNVQLTLIKCREDLEQESYEYKYYPDMFPMLLVQVFPPLTSGKTLLQRIEVALHKDECRQVLYVVVPGGHMWDLETLLPRAGYKLLDDDVLTSSPKHGRCDYQETYVNIFANDKLANDKHKTRKDLPADFYSRRVIPEYEDESEDDYGNADQCPGDVCTLGFTPIVPGLIWEVCTLGPDEARVVCAAALDWAGATDDEIDAAKRVVTIAVLDCPDTTFVGSVCADFVHFQQGNKRIYARFGAVQDRAIDIESPVTIYYGRMSSGFAECMYEETTWEAYCVSRCPWH